MNTPDVIRRRRLELGMSQAELAAAVGVDPRQVRRYEGGESEPQLQVARSLAQVLGISMDELAGGSPKLDGQWWSCWEGIDGTEGVRSGPVDLVHRGHRVEIVPSSMTRDLSDAFAWRSELYADDDNLLGYYIVDDPAARSKGTLMLTFKQSVLFGNWIRIGFSAGRGTGSLVLARDRDTALIQLSVWSEDSSNPASE